MIAHEVVDCNNQFWSGSAGCQCNQLDSCLDERNVVTVEPKSGYCGLIDSRCATHRSHVEDEQTFILSMNELLVEYSKHLNSESRIAMSGGVQQLMNKKAMAAAQENTQPRKGMGSDSTTFHDLPVCMRLIWWGRILLQRRILLMIQMRRHSQFHYSTESSVKLEKIVLSGWLYKLCKESNWCE